MGVLLPLLVDLSKHAWVESRWLLPGIRGWSADPAAWCKWRPRATKIWSAVGEAPTLQEVPEATVHQMWFHEATVGLAATAFVQAEPIAVTVAVQQLQLLTSLRNRWVAVKSSAATTPPPRQLAGSNVATEGYPAAALCQLCTADGAAAAAAAAAGEKHAGGAAKEGPSSVSDIYHFLNLMPLQQKCRVSVHHLSQCLKCLEASPPYNHSPQPQ